MDTIKGVIQKVDASSGIDRNNKPYKRWVFLIDDKKYSTFNEDIGSKFFPGEYVEMTGEKKGDYWNMAEMKTLKGEVPQEPAGPNMPSNETNDILRQILAELKK